MRDIQKLGAAVLLVSISALVACTSPEAAPSPTQEASPSSLASAGSAGGSSPQPSRQPTGVIRVGEWPLQIPVDRGPSQYANGEVEFAPDGVTPGAYIVAPGDVFEFVADRFGFNVYYLTTINQVRRGGGEAGLYTGDILTLDARTILSVGTINGEVNDYAPPNPMPEQR